MDKWTQKEHDLAVTLEYACNDKVRNLWFIIKSELPEGQQRACAREQLIAEAWGLTMVQE